MIRKNPGYKVFAKEQSNAVGQHDCQGVLCLQVPGSCMHCGGGIVHDVIPCTHIGGQKLHLSELSVGIVCLHVYVHHLMPHEGLSTMIEN